MKLDDILDDEVAIRNLKGKDLHVIGTCRECEHWEENKEITTRSTCQRRDGIWLSFDGCIMGWQKKND